MFQKNPYMKSKTISKPMLLVNIILLILLTTTYLIVCTFSCAVMILIRLILSFNKRWQLKFSLFLKSLWLNLTVTVLGFYFVHPLNICYDKRILQKKKCVVISNHLTNYDWIYVLVVLAKLRMYEDLVIILKESLSKLPVYGFGMKVFGYIFLKRDWNKDREILAKGLVKTRDRNRYFMLLFPEGTLIDPETHAKSKKFIEQNPIKLDDVEFNPENVILPRKTGFQMIYENLKDQIDGIIDITLLVNPYQQYPSEEFSLYDVFVKRSKKLDFRFVVDFVDKTEINDEQWIYRVFKKKEEMIDKYKKIDTKKVEFKDVMDKLVEQKGDEYVFDTTAIWSRWSNLQILGSLLGYALCLYFIFR